MNELSPVIQLLGQMLKASATAIINTAANNRELTVKAGKTIKSIGVEYAAMAQDYQSHVDESLELLEDVIDEIMDDEDWDDGSDCDSIPVEEQHVTLGNGYTTYGND